jgi:chromosome transmission fidelity protein 1
MVGLPFPDIKSVEIELKMNWLNKKRPGSGQILYQGLCMRAVNQCVGRAIRHRNDSALILFLDSRYAKENISQQLPGKLLYSKSIKIF